MTVEELAKIIRDWELDAGESFTDYFMHDRVRDTSWAFWLLGKGFTERANLIIDQILKGNMCLDQSLLYEVHFSEIDEEGEYGDHGDAAYKVSREHAEALYDKDVLLWAEFLLATPYYTKIFNDWYKNDQE